MFKKFLVVQKNTVKIVDHILVMNLNYALLLLNINYKIENELSSKN